MPVKEWSAHRRHLARIMRFDSVPLGKHLGMHVASPYTQPCAVRAALALSKADCVQMQVGPLCACAHNMSYVLSYVYGIHHKCTAKHRYVHTLAHAHTPV